MRKFLFIVCVGSSILFSCKKESKATQQPPEQSYTVDTSAFKAVEDIPTLDYKDLEPILTRKDDKTYVVNFWATWCKPCIKELPYFEYLRQEYRDQNVEVVLISLDFPKQKKTRLIPYINKKKLQSQLIHFDDFNEQEWIPKIGENWTGAIPATLIYNAKKRKFYEQSFTYKELENELQSFIN